MGFDDEGSGATEEILQEVPEHLDGGLGFRQMRELHAVHVQLHRFRTETEFEPGVYIAVRRGYRGERKHSQLDLYPSLFLGRIDVGLFFRLCTGLDGISVSIVPYYGGDLGISGLVLLSREAAKCS